MVVEKLPQKVENFVDSYFIIKIGSKRVKSPYYRNIKRARAELRALVGKGTPEEIGEETLIYAKLRGFAFKGKEEKEIREFMRSQGIGTDCSGFVAHIYNEWLKSEGKGHLSRHIKFPKVSFYRTIVRMLRPIENISADLLTGTLNADPVELRDVKVGDMIRLKGVDRGHHVVMISEVSRDKSGKVNKLEYVHSSPHYGEENGVKYGKINIIDEDKELKDQIWLEKDKNGVCWTYKELIREYEDNGLRRPRFLKV